MRPRIGITTSPSLHQSRFLEALDRAYIAAVLRAGAVPFVLPVLDPGEVRAVAASLDGIVFTGGGDVDPMYYGRSAGPELRGVEPSRDAYELALARQAVELGLPMLGTCRGCQLLNVALGGTLVPHLADTDGRHCARDRWAEPVHTVSLQPGSRLRATVGLEEIGVNSLHHQAVAEVGSGLRAVAWADDGVIEAIEGVDRNRIIGVQWHPELLPALPGNSVLFDWLVGEARRSQPVAGWSAAEEQLAAPAAEVALPAQLAGAAA